MFLNRQDFLLCTLVIYFPNEKAPLKEIKEYMKQNAQMQLLESERVKEKIRNFELDMWNY